MSIIGRLPPIRSLLGLCSLVGLLAAVVFAVWFLEVNGKASRVTLEQPLPERPLSTGLASSGREETLSDSRREADRDRGPDTDPLANPTFTQPETDEVKPSAPDLDLVDASPSGPLPRISTDGRIPLTTYGRPFDPSDERPKIAIMLVGLGPQTDATNAAFHLPPAISLSFSPYTEDLPSVFERARLAGHEVLIELPMEPDDYPTNDPGPHTLRASGTVDANMERLIWVLSRAPGYFAVAGAAGAFGKSAEAEPIVEAIAAKGVGMIEIDGDGLNGHAEEAGLAYTSALQWIDETPSVEAIDRALANLENRAKEEGTAIGVVEGYPISLQRLAEWSDQLDQRGIALVPVSAILIERNGILGANDQASGSNIAQTQN